MDPCHWGPFGSRPPGGGGGERTGSEAGGPSSRKPRGSTIAGFLLWRLADAGPRNARRQPWSEPRASGALDIIGTDDLAAVRIGITFLAAEGPPMRERSFFYCYAYAERARLITGFAPVYIGRNKYLDLALETSHCTSDIVLSALALLSRCNRSCLPQIRQSEAWSAL